MYLDDIDTRFNTEEYDDKRGCIRIYLIFKNDSQFGILAFKWIVSGIC